MPESHDPGVPREPDVTELLVAWCASNGRAISRCSLRDKLRIRAATGRE
jgi:hypothetical protein